MLNWTKGGSYESRHHSPVDTEQYLLNSILAHLCHTVLDALLEQRIREFVRAVQNGLRCARDYCAELELGRIIGGE
jgi:hypothetical protein